MGGWIGGKYMFFYLFYEMEREKLIGAFVILKILKRACFFVMGVIFGLGAILEFLNIV